MNIGKVAFTSNNIKKCFKVKLRPSSSFRCVLNLCESVFVGIELYFAAPKNGSCEESERFFESLNLAFVIGRIEDFTTIVKNGRDVCFVQTEIR